MVEGFKFDRAIEKVKNTWSDLQKDLAGYGIMVFIGMLISSVTCGLLAAPISVGYMKAAKKQHNGEKVEVGDAFSGLSQFGSSFLYLFLMTLALSAVYLVVFLLYILIALTHDIEVLFIILNLVWILLMIAVSVVMVLVTAIISPMGLVLISEENISAIDAFKKTFAWMKKDFKRALEFWVAIFIGGLTSVIPVVGGIAAASFMSFTTLAYYTEEKEAGKF